MWCEVQLRLCVESKIFSFPAPKLKFFFKIAHNLMKFGLMNKSYYDQIGSLFFTS